MRKTLPGSEGFTLVEVIVAFAILSITFVLIMQLFSGGLKAGRTSCDYTRAVVHAKDKMEELIREPVSGTGSFDDGFRWSTDVSPHKELEDVEFNIMKLNVKVSWKDVRDEDRTVELVSLRIVHDDESL